MTHFLLEQFTETSANWNGVAIPGRSIEKTLARHTFNVFVANADEKYSVLLRGSGTAIRFNGHELLVCTQHQLGDSDWQNVGMITEGDRNMVTSGGMGHYARSDHTDAYDLVAFSFGEPVRALPELKPRFFNLRRSATKKKEVIALLLVGCPTADQLYDVHENNHIGVAKRAMVCKLDPSLSSDPATLRVIPHEPLLIDPDGMSGGSAYFLSAGEAGFEIDFAGIIIHGGTERLTVIKAGVVINFLENLTAAW